MKSVTIIKFIDKYIGSFLVFILHIFKSKMKISNDDKNILVIRIWTLGESLLVLPMLKKLKENGFKVSVLVSNRSRSVFERHSFIDEIICFENKFDLIKKFKNYDIVFDTEPYENVSALLSWYLGKKTIGYKGLFRDRMYSYKVSYNDKIHTSAMITKLLVPFKIDFVPKELIPLQFTTQEKKNVDILLKKSGLFGKKIIGIHAGTAESSPWRSYKKENFAKLIDELVKQNIYVILTGVKNDIYINQNILSLVKNKERVFDFSGKTNLYELSYLLTKIDVFISNDTGPMHLSAAMGTKTIGLFGPNLPVRFGPLGKNNISIYHGNKLLCSPCINVHKGEFKTCKINGKCMDLITVKEIYNAVQKLIGDDKLIGEHKK